MGTHAPCRILVVEDDCDVLDAIAETLREDGHEVTTAENGAQALAALGSDPLPHVILLDLMMPVMNGTEFLRAQRQDPRLASIPVVILSGDGAMPSKAQALGIDDFLTKPIRGSALLQRVARYC